MEIGGIVWRLRLVAGALLLAALPAVAQSAPGTALGNMLGSLMSPVLNLMLEPTITGEPYTATRVSRTVQKLPDGTTLTHHKHRELVRDAEGRIRVEQVLVKAKDDEPGMKMVYIKDPVAGTLTMWTEGGKGAKVATLVKLPDMQSALKAKTTEKSKRQVEQLGQQSIDGVLVTGERITNVIPAGKVGNDQPITRTREVWTAPDLKLVMKEVFDDPRNGETTVELENFSRENPPIARFQPPVGYVVKDTAQAMKEMTDKMAAAQK